MFKNENVNKLLNINGLQFWIIRCPICETSFFVSNHLTMYWGCILTYTLFLKNFFINLQGISFV